MVDVALINTLLVAVAFFFLQMSFVTLSNAQRYLLKAVHQHDPSFEGTGYFNLTIVFATFSVTSFVAPFLTHYIGPRATMFFGSICQLIYQVQFLYEKKWLLYVSSVICGFGSCLLWTGYSIYILENSKSDKIHYIYTSMCWAIMQSGRLFTNLYVFVAFDVHPLEKSDITAIYTVMIIHCFIGCLFLLLVRKAICAKRVKSNLASTLSKTLQLFKKTDVLLWLSTFIYCGLQLSFYSAVYTNAIGFTGVFQCVHIKIIALAGVFVGSGEVLGQIIFGVFGYKMACMGRFPAIILGFIFQLSAEILIFLNIPNRSALGCNMDKAAIKSDLYIAMVSAFLLGFGDACYFAQIIHSVYKYTKRKGKTELCVIFRFIYSASTSISYLYSSYFGLYTILSILIGFSVLGTVGFGIVELRPAQETDTAEEVDESEHVLDCERSIAT